MDEVEERTKQVVSSLLAKIDGKDREIAKHKLGLDNLRQLVLDHQKEGELLYAKIQEQEKTILSLLHAIKLHPSAPLVPPTIPHPPAKEGMAAPLPPPTIPHPPVLFVRPPRHASGAAPVDARDSVESQNFLENMLDNLIGTEEQETEQLQREISDQRRHIAQLEDAIDLAEVELQHWRLHCRQFLHEDLDDDESVGSVESVASEEDAREEHEVN